MENKFRVIEEEEREKLVAKARERGTEKRHTVASKRMKG